MMFFQMINYMNSRFDEFIEERKDIKLILDQQQLLQDLMMIHSIKDNPEYLETLIEYITEIGDESNYQIQEYKYPFLASEILSKENDFFQDFLFEQQNLNYLNRLFSLLNEDTLNITQAGYFSKVILTLQKNKHLKSFIIHLYQIDISNLFKHIDIIHIAEIIEKVIIPDPYDENQSLDKRKSIIQRVMKISLNRYYEIDVFDNCLLMINNLLQSTINADQEQLIKIVLNPYYFLAICYQSQRITAYELVVNLLQYINNSGKTDYFLYFMDVTKHFPNSFTTIDLYSILHQTTYGQIIIPLSSNKLTEKEEILNELISNQSFQIITNVILQHEFNNQALIWLDKIVNFIFQKVPLMFKSIQEFLAQTIIEYNRNEKKKVGTLQNNIRPRYQGILTKISNLLVDNNYTNEIWDQYVIDTLTKINSVEQRLLFDIDPRQRSIFQSIQDSIPLQPQKLNDDDKGQVQEVEEDIPQDDNNIQENENDQEEELDKDEKFYNCNEEGRLQQLVEMQQKQKEESAIECYKSKHKLSLEEQELIDEQIEEIICDPQTKPEQIAQIIQNEQVLIDDIGPLELENKQDHQVNKYYKKHDDFKNKE